MSTPSLLEIVDQFDQKLFDYLKQLRAPSVWKTQHPANTHFVPLDAAQNILKMTIAQIPEYCDINLNVELILVDEPIISDTLDFMTSSSSGKVIYKKNKAVAIKVLQKKRLVNLEVFIHEYGHVLADQYLGQKRINEKVKYYLLFSEFCAIWMEYQAHKIEPSISWDRHQWTPKNLESVTFIMKNIENKEQLIVSEELLGWSDINTYQMATGLLQWWRL